ncbi:MAG: DUF4139 domain-containing protein [Bacteroidetes bacterium]|nr:DUF4139 domain-containing protein [Bacteroidota bacterium]
MKSFFICLTLFPFITSAQQNDEIKVKTPVSSVILYLDGAEVSQSKQVALNPGRTTVTFTGLSPKLISKSIQINTGSDVTILSVSDKINFLNTRKETLRTRQLNDSVETLTDANTQAQQDLDAFNQEKQMLGKNEAIGGQEKGVSVAELKLAADFYRARLKDIHAETFKLQKKIDKNNEILMRLQDQLAEQAGEGDLPTAEVSVLVTCAAKTTTTFDLKYVVKESGWSPSYDLTTEDVNKPIELKYRAKVYNTSGVDWNDVKIKLSTADPMQSASKPELQAWYLNFNSPALYNGYQNTLSYNNANTDGFYKQQGDQMQSNAPVSIAQSQTLYDVEVVNGKKNSPKKPTQAAIQYEEVQISELSAEFDIKQTYSVPSDARPYIVDVTTYNLNASFQYYSVPKIEKDAFMLARITGWEDLDLVEGPANVYFGGTYVGQSYINTRSVDDTLSLSFGRDKKIVVTRTKLKDFNSERSIGSNRKVTYSYEMVIKNNRKAPIQIELEDQLPVSQNSEIVVEAIELSKAERNELNGQLSWKLSLAPDETKKIILTYSVKYPKNKSVDLFKHKSKARAKF